MSGKIYPRKMPPARADLNRALAAVRKELADTYRQLRRTGHARRARRMWRLEVRMNAHWLAICGLPPGRFDNK